jgi:LysM repeat protein
MKSFISSIAVLLVGFGAGVGIGVMTNKPAIQEKQAIIDELQSENEKLTSQVEDSKSESETVIQSATKEIQRVKNENLEFRQRIEELNQELVNTKIELANLKTQSQTLGTPPEVAQGFPGQGETVTPGETDTTSVNTVEYVVKEGDSLWKIAAEQLDNGARNKEIMELNPGVNENTVLRPGMKLKLPAQ